MWKAIGASVAGRSHEAAGKGCEDASGWLAEPGLTCLAVADGAGSRPLSGTGAAFAVRRALRLAMQSARCPETGDPAACLRLIFQDVREQITAMAKEDGNDVGDYATTLAVMILAGDMLGLGQVGDTIAVVGCRGQYETVAPAPRYEYVNETTFITDDSALEQLRITARPSVEVDAVFLSTDGLRFKILADLAAATPFVPFFDDLQAYVRSPGASEDSVRRFLAGIEDQSGDDKTLVATVRTGFPTEFGDGGHQAGRQEGAGQHDGAGRHRLRVS